MGLATEPADALAITRRLFEAAAKGAGEEIAGLLHPEVVACPKIGGAPTLYGRDAVVAWWSEFAQSGAEVEARALEFEVNGQVVIVRGYLRHRDGRTLAENQVFWVYEVQDGLVIRMESHQSRAAARASTLREPRS